MVADSQRQVTAPTADMIDPQYPSIREHERNVEAALTQFGGLFARPHKLMQTFEREIHAYGSAIRSHMNGKVWVARAAETEANARADRFMAENVAVHKRYTEKCYDVAERDKKLAARDEQIAELRKALNETNARLALALDTAATMERIITSALKGETGE